MSFNPGTIWVHNAYPKLKLKILQDVDILTVRICHWHINSTDFDELDVFTAEKSTITNIYSPQ